MAAVAPIGGGELGIGDQSGTVARPPMRRERAAVCASTTVAQSDPDLLCNISESYLLNRGEEVVNERPVAHNCHPDPLCDRLRPLTAPQPASGARAAG